MENDTERSESNVINEKLINDILRSKEIHDGIEKRLAESKRKSVKNVVLNCL